MFSRSSMNLGAALLPGCQVILCVASIVLQLVSLPPSYWGTFQAQTEQGTVLERGHFGLWHVCTRRVPFFFEDCEAPITYLMLTPLSTAAGSLAIIHLLVLVAALPLLLVRLVRDLRGSQGELRQLSLAKITVVVVALVLAVIVVILGCMGTDQPAYYQVQRGWAFWVQVAVLVVDMCLVLAVALGNVQQLWQTRNTTQEEAASSYQDDFSETYSNPGFGQRPPVYDAQQRAYDTELPPPMDDDDANGLPPPPPPPPDDDGFPEPVPSMTGSGDDLTYQNPTFEDNSPGVNRRTAVNEPRYENQ